MLYPLPLEFEGSGKRTEREIYGKVKETLSHPGFENLMKPLSIKPRQCNFFAITREPAFNQSKYNARQSSIESLEISAPVLRKNTYLCPMLF